MGRSTRPEPTHGTTDGLGPRIERRLAGSALGDPDSTLRPTGGGGLLAVLASALVGLAAALALPGEMRIRWTVGTHYGPEVAPTVLVVTAFTLLTAATYLGLRWFAAHLDRTDRLPDPRWAYEACALAVLLSMLATLIGLVLANLV